MSTIDPWPVKLNASREFVHIACVTAGVICDGRELLFELASDGSAEWEVEVETTKGLVVRFDTVAKVRVHAYGKNGSEVYVFRSALRWIADKLALGGKKKPRIT